MDQKERKIDQYSYELGVMDCFCEMTASGLKRLAMSHPQKDRKEWEANAHDEKKRYEIAWRLGKLLSYPDEGIQR